MTDTKTMQQNQNEKLSVKKRSGFRVMAELIGLVKPLSGYMCLAIFAGLLGHLCAAFITILGGYAVLAVLGVQDKITPLQVFTTVPFLALLRAGLRYGEQSCNHFIAFKLLALIRDKVFRALRRLCPAKLEGRGKGDLIAVITSDIELLEVFYAHTISPAAIAFLFILILCGFIGSFHPALGLLALAAYVMVGGAGAAYHFEGQRGSRHPLPQRIGRFVRLRAGQSAGTDGDHSVRPGTGETGRHDGEDGRAER